MRAAERAIAIVHLDPATLRALADGDLGSARTTSPVALSPWLAGPDCAKTWRRRAAQIVERPQDLEWVTGVAVVDGVPVGRAGFHGAPADGTVEVGYAIDPGHRRRGYGRAALGAMLERARSDPTVRRVIASVAPGNEPSLRLMSTFGFDRTGERWDDDDGLEWVFELPADGPLPGEPRSAVSDR